MCDHYLPVCRGTVYSAEVCALMYPEEGGIGGVSFDTNRLALEEGRIRFDRDAARCVLEAFRACEVPVGCSSPWAATTPLSLGAECRHASECGEGAYCSGTDRVCGSAAGTCRAFAREGDACDSAPIRTESACIDGLWVHLTRVDMTAALGESCAPVVEDGEHVVHDCGPQLWCDTGAGVCRAYAAETCGEGPGCSPEQICIDSRCQPPSALEGSTCAPGSGLYGPCLGFSSYVCNGETHRCERTDRRIGDLCLPDYVSCVEGVCRVAPDANFRCDEPGSPGASCVYDHECASHACCDGACS
jgi:hypothetical protein